jgi:hypothetical protein
MKTFFMILFSTCLIITLVSCATAPATVTKTDTHTLAATPTSPVISPTPRVDGNTSPSTMNINEPSETPSTAPFSITTSVERSNPPTVTSPGPAVTINSPPATLATAQGNLEKQRPEVVTYLTVFDEIMNDLMKAWTKTYEFEWNDKKSYSENAFAFSDVTSQYIDALNGIRLRLNSINSPDIFEIKAHLDSAIKWIMDTTTFTGNLQAALSSGDYNIIVKEADDSTALEKSVTDQFSSLNRSTEALMTKYSISDSEIDYKLRGQ